MCDESDLFMDKSRLEKMIALGIYEDNMIDKLRTFGSNKCNDNSNKTTSQSTTHSTTHLRPKDETQTLQAIHGFQPIENSAFKWKDTFGQRKRQRTPSPVRRERIRDDIQNKISRNEIERKLNVDYFKTKNSNNDSDDRIETNSGKCNDTDLRSKSDIDSRLRDTDERLNQSTSRKNADNLPFMASAANDQDLRSSRIDERDEKSLALREALIESMENRVRFNSRNNSRFQSKPNSNNFFDNRRSKPTEKRETIGDIDEFISNCGPKPEEPKKSEVFGDLDDFIAQCQMKLGSNAPKRARGRGTDSRPNQNQRDNESYSISNAPQNPLNRPSDGNTNRDRDDSFSRRPQEDRNITDIEMESTSASEPNRNPTKHIEILRETVEEMAKSNLYCQYCDCYLSSLVEVNTHIETLIHQQNMAKIDNNIKMKPNSELIDHEISGNSEPNVSKPPTGMNILLKLIEDRKKITLKTLTQMESYEINSDKEAALAKELAKLLTNELLNYKMNLMPDNVKQALKHQGLGLLNEVSNS